MRSKDGAMSFTRIGRRGVIAGAGLLLARRAFAQTKPKVVVQTGQGRMVLELEAEKAPITVANFLHYVDTGRYDGASIYRASRAPGAPTIGIIEGGLQNDPAKLFAPIAHESTTMTGLAHVDGTISMARDAPGTATADFFICCGPASYLDANPSAPGDNAGYAAFGTVIEGMDVARAILALPTPGKALNPAMEGQILDPPVAIAAMKRMG
jgi:peptidyl-prolyl cis-trans isomerase A (cyclophilin A)